MAVTRRTSLLALAALAAAPSPLFVRRAAAQPLAVEDYVRQTLQTGLFTQTISQIALENSEAERVREFAELEIAEMIALTAVLSSTGVAAPTELSAEQLSTVQDLTDADGDEFSRIYVEAQLIAHDRALAVQSQVAQGSEITVPVAAAKLSEAAIRSHIAMLRQIEEEVG